MKILQISHTPLAGAPYHIWTCLKKYGNFENVRFLSYINKYRDGRTFPYDILVQQLNKSLVDFILQFDVLHIHNQIPDYFNKVLGIFKGKIFCALHSVPRMYNWEFILEKYRKTTFVIRQPYQMKEYESEKINSLPTLIDIYNEHLIFDLNKKPKDKIKIVFAPSNKLSNSHPASKGYNTVCKILEKISTNNKNVEIKIYSNKSHLEDLKEKQTAHIIIDDVLHDTFHLTSLCGLSCGCICISGITPTTFSRYFPESNYFPFLRSSANSLENTLNFVLGWSYKDITSFCIKARKWMEEYWNPKTLVKVYKNIYKS